MKNHSSTRIFRNSAILILLLFMGSCLDYTVTTTVNRDGSIFRQYRVRGDSSGVFHGSLMIPSGEEWKISRSWEPEDSKDTASGQTQYVYLASRTFRNIDELVFWLDSDTSMETIKPIVNIKKKFRWFYTYYEYSEIYPMSFPFQKIPVDSFLTDKEQSLIMEDNRAVYSSDKKELIWNAEDTTFVYTPADSIELNKIDEHCRQQFMRWMNASIIEEYLDVLNKHFKEETVVTDISRKKKAWINAGVQKADFGKGDFWSISFLNAIGDSLTGSNRLQELYMNNPNVFAEINRKIKRVEGFGADDSYTHILALPGRVYSTNSEKVDLTEMEWHMEKMFFFMKDYEMKASSRAANPWIMVLSGLLAVGLIGILFAKRK